MVPDSPPRAAAYSAAQIIAQLGLTPHPREGGYFRETYRADSPLTVSALRDSHVYPLHGPPERPVSTAIYYLLTPGNFSEMHALTSDEVFHFYLGDPVEMLQLDPAPGAAAAVTIIGCNLAAGQRPQVVVKRGVWQGSRLVPGGAWALMGCTVAPGFDYADYQTGHRDALSARWPQFADRIAALTRH